MQTFLRLSLVTAVAAAALLLIPTRAASPENWLGLSVTFVEDGYDFRPWPAKALRDLKVHTTEPVTVARAWVTPDWWAWLTSGKTSRVQLEADEIVARPSALSRMGIAEGRTTRKVTSLKFARLKLLMGGTFVQLPGGEMSFAEDGTLVRISLNVENQMQLEANPAADGKLALLVKTGNWKWDLLPALRFDQFVGQGTVADDGIVLDKIGANGLGGALEGLVRIKAGDGMALDGEVEIQRMDARNLLSGLQSGHTVQGLLSARVKLAAKAPSLPELASAPVAVSGSYEIRSGVIDRFGLLEGIRRPTPGSAGGGLTRFQSLEGSFAGGSGKAASVVIRRMDGGAQQATGSFRVGPDGRLNGNVSGVLKLPNGDVKSRALQLEGTVKAPDLVVP